MHQVFTIYIVDDDQGVRSSLENFLRSAGMEVRTFDSADAFLCSADGSDIDCMITDLHMPGTDGLVLLEELSRRRCQFPVIVMTAYPTDAARTQSAALGAADFLVKPIDPEMLLDRVGELLNQHKTNRDMP